MLCACLLAGMANGLIAFGEEPAGGALPGQGAVTSSTGTALPAEGEERVTRQEPVNQQESGVTQEDNTANGEEMNSDSAQESETKQDHGDEQGTAPETEWERNPNGGGYGSAPQKEPEELEEPEQGSVGEKDTAPEGESEQGPDGENGIDGTDPKTDDNQQGAPAPDGDVAKQDPSAPEEESGNQEQQEKQETPEDNATPEEPDGTPEEEPTPEQSEDNTTTPDENQIATEQSEPTAQAEGMSGDLSNFLESVEILDENGNLVEAKDIEEGKEYKFRLHFKEPTSGNPTFGPATEEQLKGAGIPEDQWKDGDWMFGELSGGIGVGDTLSGSDNVKFYTTPEGKTYILVKYEGEETNTYNIEFEGHIQQKNEDGSIDVLVDAKNGTYTPPDGTSPYMKKEAYEYDPETHHIKYRITITNPTDTDIEGFELKDTFSTRGYQNLFPKLIENSLKVGTELVDQKTSEQGRFSFSWDGTIPKRGSVVVEYELDVEELVKRLGDKAASFLVENESTVTPLKGGSGPLTDDADYRVDFGKLEKRGWKRGDGFYEYDPVIEWQIDAYDPYASLEDSKFTDKLPEKLSFDDIIGVYFKTDAGDVWFLKNHDNDGREPWNQLLRFMTKGEETGEVIFDFSKAPENLKNLFKDKNHRLEMHVLTTVQNIEEDERKGYYKNEVKTTLPSEIQERKDDVGVNIGDTGVTSQKEGEVAEGGKKLNYEVHVTVEAGISNNQNVPWRIGAGLVDRMHIKDDNGKDVFIDTSEAIEVTSVTANDGTDEEWKFLQTNGTPGHQFGVYSVASIGTQDDGYLIDNTNWNDHYTYLTAIVLNPTVNECTERPDYYPYVFQRVHGSWPEELNNQHVELIYKYSIDPAKAYFVDTTQNKRIQFEGTSTLAEYLNVKGDVRVYNSAVAGIHDSQSTADEELDLSLPLTKEGHLNVDPVSGKKTITYMVEFQNGLDNNSSLPKKATNIYFTDTFDERLRYIQGTLSAKCIMPDGTEETFTYSGDNPCNGNIINAAWDSFENQSGDSLEDDFQSQTGHYRYVFTYDLEPILSKMPDNKSRVKVENKATVKYQYNGTDQDLGDVTNELDVPTGALTKQAVLENGKVSFYVEINENKKTLSDNGRLKVEDSVSNSPDFVLDSNNILVQEYVDGKWVKLDDKDWSKVLGQDNKLTLDVPDEKHLRVWYSYSLSEEGKKKDNVEITNQVTINGIKTLHDGGKWGFATNDLKEESEQDYAILKISKVDVSSGEKLPGAKFLLYVTNTSGYENDQNTIAAIQEAKRIGQSSITYSYNGSIIVYHPARIYTSTAENDIEVDWHRLRHDQAAILVESAAPNGYKGLTDPIYFLVEKTETNSNKIILLDKKGNKISGGSLDGVKVNGDTMTVGNPSAPPGTGNLTVKKSVFGEEGDKQTDWHFRVELSDKTLSGTFGDMTFTDGAAEFTLKHGVSKTAKDLPAGITYTVTEVEANLDDYGTTSTGASGSIPENDTAQAEFVNTKPKPQPGCLTVSKTVIGTGDRAKLWHFRVELSDKTLNGAFGDMTFTDGVAEFALKHGESKTAKDLPAGITYTVVETEADQDGYTTEKSGDTGTIPEGGTAKAQFINSKPGDDFNVTKVVTGNAGDPDKEWHFRVELSDKTLNGTFGEMTFTDGVAEFTLKHGETKAARDLPVGLAYTVTEQEANQDGYTTTEQNASGTIPGSDEYVDVRFTNDKSTGGLRVTKIVRGNAGDPEKDWHFRVELGDKSINGTYGEMTFTDGVAEFTLKHGESKTAQDLPAGIEYTVTESEANQDGYKTTWSGVTGTIPEGDIAKADFINEKSSFLPPFFFPHKTPTPTPAPTPFPTGTASPPSKTPYYPQTSDEAPIGLLVTVAAIAAAGLAGSLVMLIVRRKKKKKTDRDH